MKVSLVSRDAAPSGCFTRLKTVLTECGCTVSSFIGGGKPLTESLETITHDVSSADVVLLGMSSSAELAEPEVAMGEAARAAGVPYGFYGDVPRCWARARPGAWFEKLAADAAFYCGLNEEDTRDARQVFPNATLAATGNPLREEMAFPRLTRENVRETLGIGENEKLILAPGGKFAAANMATWMVTMEALQTLTEQGQRFQLVLTTHPGDRTPHAIDGTTNKGMNLYGQLVSRSPVPTRIVGREILGMSDMVPGADAIIEFGSSIGIEGAYQRIPVITLGFAPLFQALYEESGGKNLESVQNGVSELVMSDSSALASSITKLITPEGFREMRSHQEQYCKTPEQGAALRKIADLLMQL